MENYEIMLLVIICSIGMFGGLVISGAVLGFNNSHPDNWGKYMCEQHNMEFDHIDTWFTEEKKFQFKAYCKNETKLDDGYLVVTG